MSTPVDYTVAELPDGENVNRWFRGLKEVLINGPAEKRDRILKSFVTKIYRYREPTGLQHEYVVARIERPGDTPVLLQIERAGVEIAEGASADITGDGDGTESSPRKSGTSTSDICPESPHPLNASCLKSSSSTSGHVTKQLSYEVSHPKAPAGDRVTTISALPSSSATVLEMLEVTPETITMADLALLSYVLHGSARHYRLRDCQCIWYSSAIFRVLKKAYPAETTESKPDPPRRQRDSDRRAIEAPVVYRPPPRVGTAPPTEAHVSEVCALFKEQRESLLEEINTVKRNTELAEQRLTAAEARAQAEMGARQEQEAAREQAEAERDQAKARAQAIEMKYIQLQKEMERLKTGNPN